MHPEVIIVREMMIAECFGAHLWSVAAELRDQPMHVLYTKAQVSLSESEMESIRGANVLIVGGYYRDHMPEIIAAAAKVWVFHNNSDEQMEGYETLLPRSATEGFASFALQSITSEGVSLDNVETLKEVVGHLDSYLYGWPSEEAMCFQNGVYLIDKPTDLEKLLTIKTIQDVNSTMQNGRLKRRANLRIAEQRLKWARAFNIAYGAKTLSIYSVLVGFGDSPVVDTCRLLAEKSADGIGILVRYNLEAERTFFSVGTTERSSHDAGEIAKVLFDGGGSQPMGGGSLAGIINPLEFFGGKVKDDT
jgi:hypothetical protein